VILRKYLIRIWSALRLCGIILPYQGVAKNRVCVCVCVCAFVCVSVCVCVILGPLHVYGNFNVYVCVSFSLISSEWRFCFSFQSYSFWG